MLSSYCKSPERQLCLGACLLGEEYFPSLLTSVLHWLICKTYETGNLFPSFCSVSTSCKHTIKYAVIVGAVGQIFFYVMQILLLLLIKGMLDLCILLYVLFISIFTLKHILEKSKKVYNCSNVDKNWTQYAEEFVLNIVINEILIFWSSKTKTDF